jgi:hypothetical protein
LSSPDQLRALLLKEDAAVRAGIVPEIQAAAFKPKLDRQLRLRAIRRLQVAKTTKDDDTPTPAKRTSAKTRAKRR